MSSECFMYVKLHVVFCVREVVLVFFHFFDDGGPYHIETIPLIRHANQWTSFYMIGTTVMKQLRLCPFGCFLSDLISSQGPYEGSMSVLCFQF